MGNIFSYTNREDKPKYELIFHNRVCSLENPTSISQSNERIMKTVTQSLSKKQSVIFCNIIKRSKKINNAL